ncbi:MAG: cation:proton antiporter [Bacteroidetes bacterium]|nr:cation:proton antiporter [Bacteroidota bacterium]
MNGLLYDIGIAVIASTVIGFITHKLKQPILLGYLITGALIGPQIGFGLITEAQSIEIISEIGLILLLFIIGLELNPKKLIAAGKQLLVTSIGQFLLCVLLGVGFFWLFNYSFSGGQLDGLYLALLTALSSTAIVVKILYDKFESDTLPGRITLGVLIIQDVWAILLLAIQPNLSNPFTLAIVVAILKTIFLVAAGLLFSRYVLKYVFESIINAPEMVVLMSIGWCSFVAFSAGYLGLSKEMGALIAGVSISSFPFSIHVTAKTLPLRDFFLTLFFISLGMKMVEPTFEIAAMAGVIVLFIFFSRFATVYPLIKLTGGGRRTAFITSLNLSQISEFSLVIASLGIGYGHIHESLVALLIYAMAFSSIVSSYAIKYNHQIFLFYQRLLKRLGVQTGNEKISAAENNIGHPIVILGFHRAARALVRKIKAHDPSLLNKLLVIDYNTEILREIRKDNIAGIFGDISSYDTLEHSHVGNAKMIVSTLPDLLLKGTNNKQIVKVCRMLATDAVIIATADTDQQADELKKLGASEIIFPYEMVGEYLMHHIEKSCS